MSAQADTIILGAGVVGLAIARKLAMAGAEVLVIDQAEGIGTGASSRNSEVIHAGLYYPTGSLKARLCVQGRDMLYDYCVHHGIAHRRLGKLIVATSPAELDTLAALQQLAQANGVRDLSLLTAAQVRQLEPELVCDGALLSPSTGIVDSHELMLALQGDAENHGAHCIFHTPFRRATCLDNGLFELEFADGAGTRLTARRLINACGLEAVHVARQIDGIDHQTVPDAYYCKGTYFTLAGRAPFRHLVYPVPDQAGLGVHLTLDLAGQARFGPDTEWITEIDYQVRPERAEGFHAAIRRYWPGLPDDSLQPGYTGIRPKITGPDTLPADFAIQGPRHHGVDGLVHLFGIESPGLTACLAVAEHVHAELAADQQ